MCRLAILVSLLISFTQAQAGSEFHIFDVQKNLQLSETDTVYHDYYINAGTEQGLKPGMVVQVTRRLPVHDSFGTETHEDMVIPIAAIKLIHVQRAVSVGRLLQTRKATRIPIVDYDAVMSGDRVDVATATLEGPDSSSGITAEGESGKTPSQNSAPAKAENKVTTEAPSEKKEDSKKAEAPVVNATVAAKIPEKAEEKSKEKDDTQKPQQLRSPDSAKAKLDLQGPVVLAN